MDSTITQKKETRNGGKEQRGGEGRGGEEIKTENNERKRAYLLEEGVPQGEISVGPSGQQGYSRHSSMGYHYWNNR